MDVQENVCENESVTGPNSCWRWWYEYELWMGMTSWDTMSWHWHKGLKENWLLKNKLFCSARIFDEEEQIQSGASKWKIWPTTSTVDLPYQISWWEVKCSDQLIDL